MRTVISITSVLALAVLAAAQGAVLRLPLLDQDGIPISQGRVQAVAYGPGGMEVLQGPPGPEGVFQGELHLAPVWEVSISVAGYLPARVTGLRELPGEGGKPVLVPASPVRLLPEPGTGIPWSPGRSLSWDDFRGEPTGEGPEAARIHITVSYRISLVVRRAGAGWEAEIPAGGVAATAFMDPDRSWVRPGMLAPELLAHEQGHFDIAEVYRRLLVLELAGSHASGASPEAARVELQARTSALAQGILERMEATQLRYDAETRHGLDGGAQARWLDLIAAWLSSPSLAP